MNFWISISIVACMNFVSAAPPSLKQEKKGIFDIFYDEVELDDAPENKQDYEILYDTRQTGDENYRLHIDGVYVSVPMQDGVSISPELIQIVESMYGSGGTMTGEEVTFDLGPQEMPSSMSSTTTTPPSLIEKSETQKPTKSPESITTATPEHSNLLDGEKTKMKGLGPKRNTDSSFIILQQKERPSSMKRKYKLSDIIRSFFRRPQQ